MLSLFLIAVIACGSAGKAAYKVYDELDVKEYLASQKKESHFIEQNYVDPRTTKITFLIKKKSDLYLSGINGIYLCIKRRWRGNGF